LFYKKSKNPILLLKSKRTALSKDKLNNSILFLSVLISVFLLFNGCNHNKAVQPPCVNCGVDFRVTDFEPAWSPDGKYIAYFHGDTVPGKTGIYIITPEGKENRLFQPGTNIYEPTWSPDGQWIVFSDKTQIWKKKLNGDSLIQLTTEGRNFFPAWSPDGNWIAYHNTDCGCAVCPPPVNSCGILFIHKDSGQKKLIVSGEMPNWMDNKNLLYVGLKHEIYKFSLLDSSVQKITDLYNKGAYGVSYPKYSYINNKIIFSAQYPNANMQNPNSKPQIFIMDLNGSNVKQLTQTQAYSCDWSPDGRQIIYTDSRGVNGRLWLMNADGSEKKQLTF
jgi:Tol biopolymer transport system component